MEDTTKQEVTPWNEKDIHFKLLPRSSPGTSKVFCWLAQLFSLVYAFFFKIFIWEEHKGKNVTLDRRVYFAKDHSRHESLLECDSFVALVDSIRKIPKNKKVVLLVSSADRLGVDYDIVSELYDVLHDRDNLEIEPLEQYNFDFKTALQIVARRSEQTKEISKSSSRMNAGKSIPIEGEDNIEKAEAIKAAAADINQSIRDKTGTDCELVRNAHSLGKELELEGMIDQTTLRNLALLLARLVKQVDNDEITPEEAAEELKKYIREHVNVPNRFKLVSQQISLFFTRSSRASRKQGLIYTEEGVPVNQASICVAAKEYNEPESKTVPCIIHDDERNRDQAISEKIALVIVLAYYGVVDSIYLSTLVRLSGMVSVIRICLVWFKMFHVDFEPVDCTGKAVMGVALDEFKRQLALSLVIQEKEEKQCE